MLEHYSWPGNVRELEHSIERACVLCGEGELMLSHFNLQTNNLPAANPPQEATQSSASFRMQRGDAEQGIVLQALEACNGNKTVAAEMLGITRATLYRKLKKYNIS